MTDLLPRLATLPAVRFAAEEQARALTDTIARAGRETPFWDALPERMRLERVNAHLARLLDPNNPAAEGVLADIYRRETEQPLAYADPGRREDGTVAWQVVRPLDGVWVGVPESLAPTRYEAWGRALAAHYDLAARKDGTLF